MRVECNQIQHSSIKSTMHFKQKILAVLLEICFCQDVITQKTKLYRKSDSIPDINSQRSTLPQELTRPVNNGKLCWRAVGLNPTFECIMLNSFLAS